ncbi:MAG: NAD-dependent epimerase/dehydratase family protein [Actinomycetota bacterium]
MRVLVTGAAGFIGSRLSRALLERGDEVVGLDNLNDYYPLALKELHLADLLPHVRFRFIREDLRNAEAVQRIFAEQQPDAVAHLAAMAAVRYSIQHPLIYGEVNVQGSLNLLEAARNNGRPRLVLASTGSVYGSDTPTPFQPTAAAAHPLAPYPASKRSMELFAHSYQHLYGLPITVFRFFNVYGPHGRPDMMPWQWAQQIHRGEPITLFNGGRMHRDWTYIDDVVAGLLAALDRGLSWEILNLGRGCPVENIEFVRVLERLLEREAVIVDAPAPASEPAITFADVSRTRELLGYEPQVSVDEGLARFVAWLRAEKLL